jgi:hypothetical protein
MAAINKKTTPQMVSARPRFIKLQYRLKLNIAKIAVAQITTTAYITTTLVPTWTRP